MRIVDCEQGSPEWRAARAGKVTASRIADLTAKTKSGPAASRANYAAELVAERLTGKPAERSFKSAAMEFGNECEAEARSYYAFVTDVEVSTVGMVLHPTMDDAAASPDGLVGEEGIVQFKCPYTATHIDMLLTDKVDGKYIKQVQWEMACTGRQWCDFVSYDVNLPGTMRAFRKRIPRDDKVIAELEAEVVSFIGEVEETVAALRQKFLIETTEEKAA